MRDRSCLDCPHKKFDHEPITEILGYSDNKGDPCEIANCDCPGYNPGVADLVGLDPRGKDRLAAQRDRLNRLEMLDDAECPNCGSSTACVLVLDKSRPVIIAVCWACGEYELAK